MTKNYIFNIFQAEHYAEDDSYSIGFGYKNKENFFDIKNFQLNIKKDSSLEEFGDELLQLSLIIKEVIKNNETN